MLPSLLIGSGRLILSCLVPYWLSAAPAVRSFRPNHVSIVSMPVSTRARRVLVAETATSIFQEENTISTRRRNGRRLLVTMETSTGSDGTTEAKIVTTKVSVETKSVVTPSPRKRKPTTTPNNARKTGKSTPRSVLTEIRAPPKDWESIYALVEELRQDRTAPVDSDGSEALPDKSQGEKVFRFQVLISLMLSSQTKDAIVGETMRALQEHGLTVVNIAQTSHEKLNSLIRRVGFHNNKTKYIKETVEILISEYNGDIPPNAVEMMKLPGVGPKMAFIVENVGWGTCSGIGIDTHMHRMFNELKWVDSKNPEQTRKQLESWLPKDRWMTVNVVG